MRIRLGYTSINGSNHYSSCFGGDFWACFILIHVQNGRLNVNNLQILIPNGISLIYRYLIFIFFYQFTKYIIFIIHSTNQSIITFINSFPQNFNRNLQKGNRMANMGRITYFYNDNQLILLENVMTDMNMSILQCIKKNKVVRILSIFMKFYIRINSLIKEQIIIVSKKMPYFIVQSLDMWGGDIQTTKVDSFQEALVVAKSQISSDSSKCATIGPNKQDKSKYTVYLKHKSECNPHKSQGHSYSKTIFFGNEV